MLPNFISSTRISGALRPCGGLARFARDVYSTKGTSHWGTEENRPWEENRPQLHEKIANFGVFTLF